MSQNMDLDVANPIEKIRRQYTEEFKKQVYDYYKREGCTQKAAAEAFGIPASTISNWVRAFEREEVDSDFSNNSPTIVNVSRYNMPENSNRYATPKSPNTEERKIATPKLVQRRKPDLNEKHKEYLRTLNDEIHKLSADVALEYLAEEFDKLDISSIKKGEVTQFLKDTDFTMTRCFPEKTEDTRLRSASRNFSTQLQMRQDWATALENQFINSYKNCIFIDKAWFHLRCKSRNLESLDAKQRSIDEHRNFEISNNMDLFFGAMTTDNIIEICRAGTIRDDDGSVRRKDYLWFVKKVMDRVSKDNIPYNFILNHVPEDYEGKIKQLILSNGYNCFFVPSFADELSPMTEIWKIYPSYIRREKSVQIYEELGIAYMNIPKEKIIDIVDEALVFFNKAKNYQKF